VEYSPPASPLIDRRPLDVKTESVLRAACASLVRSHHTAELSDLQPMVNLNFQTLQSMKEKKAEEKSAPHHKRDRTNDLPYLHPIDTNIQPKQYAYKPDTALEHLFPESDSTHPYIQANVGRRRDSSQPAKSPIGGDRPRAHKRHDSGKLPRNRQSADKTKEETDRDGQDSPDTTLGTPLTGSTDPPYNHLSTAPTSVAALSPCPRDSRRNSRHAYPDDNALTKADIAAVEWMRQELERRRNKSIDLQRKLSSKAPSKAESKAASNTVSRKWSLKEEIKDYIRPRTSHSLSRQASKESLRPQNTAESTSSRATTSHGWRSWGMQRKSSGSNASSRPSSSKGYSEKDVQSSAKPAVDLNRELPPLPSLDTWQEPQSEAKSTAHIATLVRSGSRKRDKTHQQDPQREVQTIELPSEASIKTAKPIKPAEVVIRARPIPVKTKSTEPPAKRNHRHSLSLPDVKEGTPIASAGDAIKEEKNSQSGPVQNPTPASAPAPEPENALKSDYKFPDPSSFRIPSLHFDSLMADQADRPKTADPYSGKAQRKASNQFQQGLHEKKAATKPVSAPLQKIHSHQRSLSAFSDRSANGVLNFPAPPSADPVKPTMNISVERYRENKSNTDNPNFSRKYSCEYECTALPQPGQKSRYDPRFPNMIETVDEKKSAEKKKGKGLRKVFSTLLFTNKSKSGNGHKQTLLGISEATSGPAPAPVVKI
jgi:hypothetical protein